MSEQDLPVAEGNAGAGRPMAVAPPVAGDGPPCDLQPVFVGRRKTLNRLGIALWLASLAYFWTWWCDPAHVHSPGRYMLVTLVLLWTTLLPAYFIFLFGRARIVRRDGQPFAAQRVAMVVTKAPSEPFDLVRKTLEGMLAQRWYRYDVWLADEDPDAETRAWCSQHGVQLSSRKGVADYHRLEWPRRTHCKEGNLAYFYDHYGYDRYDFVAQFDADHIPSPDYLRHVLAPFADPRVGYVSAPSICDANAARSWSARGRLYVEASMHGALQTGYNAGFAPLCIGSHYAVRTAALRAIGGLGPELAEDHSTSLLFNAHGWRGVHAVDAIAHGEGPETFANLVVQEFQWSRSLVTILLRTMPGCFGRLPLPIRFQFLFSELWYPAFSLTMAVMFLMPVFALVTRQPFANVTYIDYFLHILPLSATLLGLAYWWRATGLFRPADAKIISWEGMAFLLLRWPWSLLGSLAAVWDRVTGSRVDFRITPKAVRHTEPVPLRVIAPYLFVAILAAGTAWYVRDARSAGGFYVFNLVTAASYLVLVLMVLILHARENRCSPLARSWPGAGAFLALVAVVSLMTGAAYSNGLKGLAAVNVGITAFTLTETLYSPAGAGRHYSRSLRFNPRWHGFGRSDTPQIERARGTAPEDEQY